MRIIYTLLIVIASITCFGQHAAQSRPVQTDCLIKVKSDTPTLANLLANKASSCFLQPKADSLAKPVRIFLHCQRTFASENEALVVLDGVPLLSCQINYINPSDIERIDILKNAEATAIYGCRALNGVILITTRHSKERIFRIKDFLDGSPIGGATVAFVGEDKRDTLMFAANDSGAVITDKLKPGLRYNILVSAAGYSLENQTFLNSGVSKSNTILLTRNIITCPEAIISYWPGCGSRLKVIGYPSPTKKDSVFTKAKERATKPLPLTRALQFKIYPTLVQAGSVFNVQLMDGKSLIRSIVVAGSNGLELIKMPVYNHEGRSIYQVSTDPRWSAGIYFVRIFYENGQAAASSKIIVQ